MKQPRTGDRRGVDETLVDFDPGQTVVRDEPPSAGPAGPGLLAVSLATDVGRVRHNNEDFVAAERVAAQDGAMFGLWLVADGVGGGPRGEQASRMAVETVIDFMAHNSWSDPARALTQAFGAANLNVYDLSGEGASATTMVAALVSENDSCAYIANVGDSRAYQVSGGEVKAITDDHSIVAARVAAGQITADEARTAPDRNVVTRSIGSERDVLVDVFGPRQLLPGQRLVLCTDGVHGMLNDTEFARIASTSPIGEAAAALVAAAVDAGGRDNATALVGASVPLQPGARSTLTSPGAERARRFRRSPSPWAVLSAVLLVVLVLLVLVVLSGVRPGS
jgi:PPM family protein phosphatase